MCVSFTVILVERHGCKIFMYIIVGGLQIFGEFFGYIFAEGIAHLRKALRFLSFFGAIFHVCVCVTYEK